MLQTGDYLFVEKLTVDAKIGVLSWEKAATQKLLVDLTLNMDLTKPGLSDNLEDGVDYKAVTDLVAAHAQKKHYELLEHFAESLATRLFELFPFTCVKITVHKPKIIPNAVGVGIHITRERNDI